VTIEKSQYSNEIIITPGTDRGDAAGYNRITSLVGMILLGALLTPVVLILMSYNYDLLFIAMAVMVLVVLGYLIVSIFGD
jgi:hypothetical protein